jgi:hypothetical protein
VQETPLNNTLKTVRAMFPENIGEPPFVDLKSTQLIDDIRNIILFFLMRGSAKTELKSSHTSATDG